MQLDFDAVGVVGGWLVEHDMPAGDEEQAALAFEEEAGRAGEREAAFIERRHPVVVSSRGSMECMVVLLGMNDEWV